MSPPAGHIATITAVRRPARCGALVFASTATRQRAPSREGANGEACVKRRFHGLRNRALRRGRSALEIEIERNLPPSWVRRRTGPAEATYPSTVA